jgi:hypothetical protein
MAITLPLCVLVFAALPMAADGSFKSDRILVRFAPGAVSFPSGVSSADLSAVTFSPAALQDSLEAAGVETLDLVCESWRGLPAGSDLLPFDDIYALEVSGGAESVAETVETLPQIEDVSLSHYYTTMFQPNDPLYSQQWHLENDHLIWTDGFGEPQATLPDVDLDMEDAWDILQGVNDVPVFVIDTPVASHPDLQGVASPSGVSGNCGPIAWSGSHVHGTAVAGIIAARCNNSTGVAGINCAPSPSNVIVTINAGSPDVEAELAVCGLEYAATNAARVINNSWGAFDLDDFCMAAAVRNAYLSGSLVVCAAGNKNVPGRNDPVYPAEYKTTMSVGAITHTGVPWWNAVHRPSMDLAAPGGRNSISTTWVSGGTPQYTDMMSGTSAAAPMVSGVAALLVGVESSLTNDDLRYVLNRTARDIPPAGRDNLSGAGLVSAWRALRFVSDSSRVFGQALLSSSSVAVTDTSDVYLKLFKHLGWCFGDSSLPDSWTSFPVRRLTLEGIATFGAPYLSDHRNVWVRRESAFSPGWPDVDSLDCVQETGCGDVVESSWSSTSAVLRSYTYEVLSPADSSFLGFFPVHPDSVSMPYSYVLGDFDDAPTAQVVSPNGGEVYIAGSHSIEWVASDDDGDRRWVVIPVRVDDGAAQRLIVDLGRGERRH